MSVAAAYEALRRSIVGSVRRDEPMSRHTTYRIGGPADLFVACDTVNDVSQTLRILEEEEVPNTVLGKGSNLLVSDEGYRGAVVTLGRDFRRHGAEGDDMRCGAGVTLAGIVRDAYSRGLEGFAFGVGVPGTVGGALVMNAGTRDEWIGSLVESVTVYSSAEGLLRLRGDEIRWAYRETDLAEKGVVLECCLRAEAGDTERVRQAMEARFSHRKETQPLSQASAGSVFKNPPGDSAGRMIETLGAKGMRVGGAMVSEVHANFIVNTGGACASDVMYLIDAIRTAVKDAYDVGLETEIRFLGPIGIS